MRINRIAVVSVPVANAERAKKFYRDVLGFDVVRDDPMGPEQQWIQVAPSGAETTFTLVTWFPHMPPGSMQGCVLNTDNIDNMHALLQERGLQLSPIEEAPWGRYATFNDPDGNGFVLQQNTY